MKNLVKMAFAAVALFLSVAASAQSCVPAPYTMNGGPQRCWGQVATTTTTTTQPTWQLPYGSQVFSQGFAQNNGFTNCQLVGGAVGATLGSLAKHHTAQAVILGAIGGGVVGNMYCTNNQGQRIVVQQAPQQQWQQQVVAQTQQPERLTPKQIVAKLQMEIPNPPEGEYTCPFIADGEKLAVIKTVDQSSCVKWTDTVATAAGWKRN